MIAKNELAIVFDADTQSVTTYRPHSEGRVVQSRYALADMKKMTFAQAAQLIGVDILLALEGTRLLADDA